MKSIPTFIAPERLYTLRGFREASGFSQTRMREARLRGIELPTLSVGRRKFVRGTEAIAFIERLAAENPATLPS
jgi:hypothetical protein